MPDDDNEVQHLVLLPHQRALLDEILAPLDIQIAGPIPTDNPDEIPAYILSPTEDAMRAAATPS